MASFTFIAFAFITFLIGFFFKKITFNIYLIFKNDFEPLNLSASSPSDPKIKLYNPLNPNKIKKYNDKLLTYLTSRF